jgi:hypothetical protein
VSALLAQSTGRAGERTLVVICAYAESLRGPEDPRPFGLPTAAVLWGLDHLLPRRFSDHRVLHRDHFANPRPLPYLLDLVERWACDATASAAPDLLVDGAHPEPGDGEFRAAFGRVERGATARFESEGVPPLLEAAFRGDYDTVVLVHPDALGLGCERLERALLSDPARRVLVVSGRRRAYALGRNARCALRLRRFLARTRLVELLAALAVWPVAGALAAFDAVRGRLGDAR